MNENKVDKNWTEFVLNERITKSFTLDIETLGKIKQFKEKYNRSTLSKAIDDLVNIGLASVGYRTNEEITARFKGYNDFEYNPVDISILESLYDKDFSPIIPNVYDKLKIMIDIIHRLCDKTRGNLAKKEDILMEAEKEDMESEIALELIDRLKKRELIYEPIYRKYKITEY